MKVCKLNWCTVSGTATIVAGVLLTVCWDSIFHLYRRHIMVLRNGSMAFELWRDIPIPIYTEFYLYNITNVEDILAGKNVKIRVQQMGPYVFREEQKKVNIVWNDNSTISYQTQRTWYFEPDRSNGSLSDVVTNVDPLIPALAYLLRYTNSFLQILANMVTKLYYRNMFVSANVSSWLFDGIESHLISITKKIPSVPYFMPYDRIGWLYTRNGSADYEKWFVVNTGADDFSRIGKVELWDHANQTGFPGSCGEVRGSTGELWAPKKDQPEISIFAADLRTTLTLAATEPITVRGVEGIMFMSNDSLFDNGQKYPSKACHCKFTPNDCMPSGVLNASICAYGAPTFVTLPHLRNVPAYYADKIEGMEPTDDDDFKMAIELVTGLPLMVRAQFQVNMLVRHSQYITINNQLPDADVLVPMVWVRQPATVDDHYAAFARTVLAYYYRMPYVFYGLITLGVLLLAAGLWLMKTPTKTQTDNAETHKFLAQCDTK